MQHPLFGVVAPHPPIMVAAVGGSRAQVTHDSLEALDRVRQAVIAFAPETLVVMSPHAPALSDAFAVDDSDEFVGDLSQFGDPTVYRWPGDSELACEVLGQLERRGLPAESRLRDARLEPGVLDHATIVPLSFIEPTGRVPIVVLSLSALPYSMHRHVGEVVRSAAEKLSKRTAFIASGDLSHRLTRDAPAGYAPEGERLDRAIVALVESGRLDSLLDIDPDLVHAGGECGLRSFIALGGYFGEAAVPSRVLSYEGPWGVGYLTAVLGERAVELIRASDVAMPPTGRKGGMAGDPESEIVRLARAAIEEYVRGGVTLMAPRLVSDDYPQRAGAFVSLHRGGELRGCIGTILPTRNTLAEEVVSNAVEAATHDPRFPPVSADELDRLELKVDVLHEPEACTITDLDPSVYGVITASGWRRGLLLPDLEGVDDVTTQVRIAMNKAGIREGEPCSFERFRVERYT